MSKQLVRLINRLTADNEKVIYYLDFKDEHGNRKRVSLQHSNKKKAEQQRAEKEQELKTGISLPDSMKLREFMNDSLTKTGKQIRESTNVGYKASMNAFIEAIGDIDYRSITHRHGEVFLKKALDNGQSRATVSKKLREINRFFQLAVQRGQLDENPLRNVKAPKAPKKKVRTYTSDECNRILKAARQYQKHSELRWDLLITLAMVTGMRKSELLNTVWDDIDFAKMTIDVQPKADTEHTWEWHIKDVDCRTLPLTEQVTQLLANLQNNHPEGYPYVFVPPHRYDRIQQLRQSGKWTLCSARLQVVNNFTRQFKQILEFAGVKRGQFHDLRRTSLSDWLGQGMSTFEVMVLAGHAKFSTTQEFYLAVASDILQRARQASEHGLGQNLAQFWHSCPLEASNEKGQQA